MMAAIRIAGGKWMGSVQLSQMDPRLAREIQKAKAQHPAKGTKS